MTGRLTLTHARIRYSPLDPAYVPAAHDVQVELPARRIRPRQAHDQMLAACNDTGVLETDVSGQTTKEAQHMARITGHRRRAGFEPTIEASKYGRVCQLHPAIHTVTRGQH